MNQRANQGDVFTRLRFLGADHPPTGALLGYSAPIEPDEFSPRTMPLPTTIARTLSALLGAATLAFLPASHAAPKVPPVEIHGAEFGLFLPRGEARTVFEPTHTVPHQTGQRYGWVIELRTKARAVSVSEEYILPPLVETKPDPLAEAMGFKNERRNQVSQRRLVPVEGKIYGEWEIGPQEPAGKRTLQVIVEGADPVRFEYEVK